MVFLSENKLPHVGIILWSRIPQFVFEAPELLLYKLHKTIVLFTSSLFIAEHPKYCCVANIWPGVGTHSPLYVHPAIQSLEHLSRWVCSIEFDYQSRSRTCQLQSLLTADASSALEGGSASSVVDHADAESGRRDAVRRSINCAPARSSAEFLYPSSEPACTRFHRYYSTIASILLLLSASYGDDCHLYMISEHD